MGHATAKPKIIIKGNLTKNSTKSSKKPQQLQGEVNYCAISLISGFHVFHYQSNWPGVSTPQCWYHPLLEATPPQDNH